MSNEKKGYDPPKPDHLAAYHILELADQGRPVETIAQFIAGWFLSGEMRAQDMVDQSDMIRERVLDLCLHPEDVWDGLLPGGNVHYNVDMFTTLTMDYFGELDLAQRKVKDIEDAFAKNYNTYRLTDYGQRLEAIGEILHGRSPEAEPKQSGDKFTYMYSIIIDPSVRHDETTDLIKDASPIEAESVLNLASSIKQDMDTLMKMDRWPAEELAAWITHVETNNHWLMTYDQASAIVHLDEAKEQLEALSGDHGIDWDDSFQGIADMMSIAGEEYAAGK